MANGYLKILLLIFVLLNIKHVYGQSVPRRIYVSNLGNDLTGNGAFDLPIKNIQSAIDRAINGDTIIVSQGVYYESINTKGKQLVLTSNYLFSKDTLDIRKTIIDGNNQGDVITCNTGETRMTKISGFTIRNGKNGIIISSSPHLSDLYITANKGTIGWGAGLFANGNCGFLLERSIFEKNDSVPSVVAVFNLHSDSMFHFRNIIIRNNNNVSYASIQTNGQGGGLMENVLVDQYNAFSLSIQNVQNGLRVVNCTFISRNNGVIDCVNNQSESKVFIINTIVSSDISGSQFNVFSNYPRTYLSFVNSYVKNGVSGLSIKPTTVFLDSAKGINKFQNSSELIDIFYAPTFNSKLNNSGAKNYYYNGKIYNVPTFDLFGNTRMSIPNQYPSIGAIEGSNHVAVAQGIPTISDFTPTNARIGETILINGSNFDSTYSVFIGEKNVKSFNVVSSNIIVATVENTSSGSVMVRTKYGVSMKSGFIFNDSFPAIRNTKIHVSINGNDYNTVGFINSPFRNIQTAINYAKDGDTVLVSRGTYFENIVLKGKKIFLTSNYFISKDTLDIRNTIIDGNNQGDVITLNSGENKSTKVSGFTVRNGWNGIIISSSPHITDMYITQNRCLVGWGAGLFANGNCSFLLERTIFENNNDVESVAAVFNLHSDSAFKFQDVIFRNNRNINTAAFQNNGQGGGYLTNVLIVQDNASALGINNSANGLFVINCTLNNTNKDIITHFNNQSPTKLFLLNTILYSNKSGQYLDLTSNSTQTPTEVWISNSYIKGGISSIKKGTTTYIRDTTDVLKTITGFQNEMQGNFRLKSYSPLIGSGKINFQLDGKTILIPSSDIEQFPRPFPVNSKPDIGAFEHVRSTADSSYCDSVQKGFNPFIENYINTNLDSLPLTPGSGYLEYNWSNGLLTSTIYAKSSGQYKIVVLSADGCLLSDSVYVQFPDTVGLHVSTVSGVCNRQVDVPVRATSFRHMLTMQGSVNWNAADLRLDSISGYGPASLGMNVGNFGTAQSSSGKLTFSWNDQSGNGLSLADSTTIFTLRFTILGTSIRSIPVVISGSPTSIEFYDATLTKKTTSLTPGAVNVTCEFLISGRVLTPTDKGVKNVTVTLSGGSSSQTATTDSAGNYTFKVLTGTYTLTPSKSFEQYKTNGVSTLDIALIQAHLLQKTPFNAAYKVIASDANNNSGISTADILSIRRLILNTDTSFPNNRNWAFVDGEQTFANPLTPFPFNTTKTYTNLSTDIAHTFRGIKIGDVNYDRNPLLDQAPSGDTLRLFGEWTDTEDGYATLRVKSHAVSGLLGWQSTLRWDVSQLKLQSVNGKVSNLGIGERWKDEGYLTMSWNDPRAEGLSFTEGSTWMELRFLKTRNLKQASIGITEQKLGTEAFNGNYQSMGVKMEPIMLRGNAWEGMLRIYPNPVSSMVNVEWKMEKAGAATIRLLDAQGRVVHMERGDYAEGVQRISIRRSSGWSVAGTWMVQMESDGVLRNVPVVMVGE